MSQTIREECPYCESMVLAKMEDTVARKATRWVAKKGITGSVEHIGNAFTGVGGTVVAQGLKIFASDSLDKAGHKLEDSLFEEGNFDFACPNCKRQWRRYIKHNIGDMTIRIDHDYVREKRHDDIMSGIYVFFIFSIICALGMWFVFEFIYPWYDSIPKTNTVYSEGFLGIGGEYKQETNYYHTFASAVFHIPLIGFACTGLVALASLYDSIKIKTEDIREYRFRLLTPHEEDE